MQVGQEVLISGNGLHGQGTIVNGTTPHREAMGFILVAYKENNKMYWVQKKYVQPIKK